MNWKAVARKLHQDAAPKVQLGMNEAMPMDARQVSLIVGLVLRALAEAIEEGQKKT